MAVMRSLNLGQPASIGTPGQRRLDLAMLRRPAAPANPIAPIDEKSISRQTLADILAEGDLTRPTVSGSLLEGLTRGGEAYLRARGGRERAMGEAEQAQTAAAVAASDREREIEMDRARLAEILASTDKTRTEIERGPDSEVRLNSGSGTFWREDPNVEGGYRVLGRDPNWTPPAAMMFQPPPGYTGSQESLRPIPGGPADARVNEAGRRRLNSLQDSANNLANVLSAIDQAQGIPSGAGDLNPFNDTTGFFGDALRNFAGTPARDLKESIEPVLANLGFESLAEMRRNSETGGALGGIAVREIDLLQKTVRSLEQAQSNAQFRENLAAVRAQVEKTAAAIRAAQNELATPFSPNGSNPQASGGAIRWGRDANGNPVRLP